MTACNDDHSIQALSYCAKNPSQKLPPDEAKSIRLLRKNTKLDDVATGADVDGVFKTKKSFDFPHLSVMFALIMKNLIKMSRNFTGLLFVFLLPMVEVVFFCIAVGQNPKNLPFAIGKTFFCLIWSHYGVNLVSISQHNGMFFKVLFRCENVGRQRDFANF